jgi:hypothetical protein
MFMISQLLVKFTNKAYFAMSNMVLADTTAKLAHPRIVGDVEYYVVHVQRMGPRLPPHFTRGGNVNQTISNNN